MKIYEAEALDKEGKLIKSRIVAENEDEIVHRLRECGYYPLKVVISKEGTSGITMDSIGIPLLPKEKEIELYAEFKRLIESIIHGNDDSYHELLQKISNPAIEGWQAPESLINYLKGIETILHSAGSANRFREIIRENLDHDERLLQRLLDNDSFAIEEIIAKWQGLFSVRFTDKGNLVSGELVIIHSKLGFIQKGPEGRQFFLLCALDEIADISLKGLFTKKIRLTTSDGRSWNFVPTEGALTIRKDRMMRIFCFEIHRAKSDPTGMGIFS